MEHAKLTARKLERSKQNLDALQFVLNVWLAVEMDNATCKHYEDVCFVNYTVSRVSDAGYFADFLKGTGCLFYVVNPNETSYKELSDVPNYYRNVSVSLVILLSGQRVLSRARSIEISLQSERRY